MKAVAVVVVAFGALVGVVACGSNGGGGTGATGAGGSGSCPSDACTACVNSMCATEESDCSMDIPCNRAQNTWGPCVCSADGDMATLQSCDDAFSSTDATAMAALSCIQQSCAADCAF